MYSLNTSELKSAPSHQGCWRHGPHQTIYASLCAELYDHSDVAGSHFLWWLPSIVCSGGGLVECPIPSVRLLSMKGWTQVWVGYFVAPETPKCFLESSSSQLGCQPETSTLYSLYTYGQKHLPLQIVNTCLLWSLCFLHNILLVFSISTFWTSSQSSVDDSKIHVTCSRILCPETTNQTPICQEATQDKRVLCASVLLNEEPELLQQRIGNAVYDRCRAKTLSLAGFPDYEPLVCSLKESTPTGTEVVYKVCAVRHDKLLVLQSLTRRWLEFEGTRDEAHAMVEAHNKQYNADGEFMENDERTCVWILLSVCTISYPLPFPTSFSKLGDCATSGAKNMIRKLLQKGSKLRLLTQQLKKMWHPWSLRD